MTKILKLGLIGLGMGRAHLSAIAEKIKEIELFAAADINEEKLNKVCDSFNIRHRFADYMKMLEMDEIDAVLVATPNHLHAPMAIDSMKAGKHVLVEKPPAIDVEGAQKMAEASKKTGKKLMYAFCNRFRADIQEAKKLAEAGELGDIYYARASWFRRYGIPGSDWFSIKAQSGGGPMIDLGVHILDMTWWVMGCPKPVSVSGVTYNPFMKKLAKKGYDVEDLASALIRFKTGESMVVEATWATFTEHENVNSMIFGTKGGIEVKLNPKKDETYFNFHTERKGTWLSCTSPEIEWKVKESSLGKQLRYFAECIQKNKPNISSGDEGVEVMKMLTAVYESAKIGKEVVLK